MSSDLQSADGRHVIHFADSRHMTDLKDGSVQLTFSSPPYGLGFQYGGGDAQIEQSIKSWADYNRFVSSLHGVWDEVWRVTEPSGFVCINVANINGRSEDFGECITLPSAHETLFYFLQRFGAILKTEIIWRAFRFAHNASNTSGSHILGGYPYPCKGITMRDIEYIWVLKKPGEISEDRERRRRLSKFKDARQWFDTYGQVWDIQGERKETTGGIQHPAPFPVELAERVIRGYSVVDDTVLDPFAGTGTVCLAARNLGRKSVGYELNEDFRGHILAKTKLFSNSLNEAW